MSELAQTSPEASSTGQDAAGLSVGSQLRLAREKTGISHAEVAQALKFSLRQIEALEADDFRMLPGVTMRGFVRSYARFLKLDAELMLSQLDSALPNAPAEVRPPDNMGIAMPAQGQREFSPLVSVALVLLLAALLMVLWHFFAPSAPRIKTVSGQAGLISPRPSDSPPATNALAGSPAVPTAGVMAPVVDPALPPQAEASTEMAAPALRFSFFDRSWVEVTDANRQLLHSGENPGGSHLVLTGKPPFDLVIGNAGKVKLAYGDRNIDLVPHMRAEVARLTLE